MVDDPNGRVTLAVLQNEIQHLRRTMEEQRDDDRRRYDELQGEFKWLSTQIVQLSNDHLKRITELERLESAKTERWIAHKEEHARENKNQATFAAVVSTFTSTIAGIAAALIGGRP